MPTLESPSSRPANQSRRTLKLSRRAPRTARSETECSEQTLRGPPRLEVCSIWSPRQHSQISNMSEDKHSWDRVPAWDGHKRQWKRYLRDVSFKLNLETEKLDVDSSHGARLLFRLTGSSRKYAETITLDEIGRSTGFFFTKIPVRE